MTYKLFTARQMVTGPLLHFARTLLSVQKVVGSIFQYLVVIYTFIHTCIHFYEKACIYISCRLLKIEALCCQPCVKDKKGLTTRQTCLLQHGKSEKENKFHHTAPF